MTTLNLGILAHVDAGKTSLTERLLHAAGVIGEAGSVDDGDTQTDSLALERARGITIKSAVVSFRVGGRTVNLIDTPGHPDFIAEVERVLSVLDGAVLVVSAVAGVQPQTTVLMRALRRLRIPTLIFVNKIDSRGAGHEPVLEGITDRLSAAAVPLGEPAELGTRHARCAPYAADSPGFVSRLTDLLTANDDALLAAYVADERAVPYRRLRTELAAQTRRAQVCPVLFGSAVTGAGVAAPLTAAIAELLPASSGDADGPVSGTVFKVERGPAGEKIAYVRMFSGTVRVRDRVPVAAGAPHKVTAISVFEHGGARRGESITAGRIGRLWGLGDVRIGDPIGARTGPPAAAHFAPPTLETVVVPRRAADTGRLRLALTQLAEQDPLINVRQDDRRRELSVSLYGEVQKEVIGATLADEFGVRVDFHQTTTICVERLAGTGSAAEFIGVEPNPFLATVGLRVEPAVPGTGVTFRLDVEPGSMPSAFMKAVAETVRETLDQGVFGWRVVDCAVTMTHSGYLARQSHSHGVFDKSMSSTAGDFRNLTPLVLMTALRRAGTVVHEPMHRFRLELPAELAGPAIPALAQLRAVPGTPVVRGSTCVLDGEIPAARVHDLRRLLPNLSRGEGVVESTFDNYRPVHGAPPSRQRTDHNPLNRKEYLLRVTRRVAEHPARG